MSTTFLLNGTSTTLDADPDMPLLWAIREVAGLHGTKFGCGMAMCGACTVHVDGQAIRSCVMPLSAVCRPASDDHRGVAEQAGQGGAGRLDRTAGAAVRLLPVGPDHVGHGAAGEKSRADAMPTSTPP